MTITALPTPPTRQDPDNFSTRADQFLSALPQFGDEANVLAASLNSIEANSAASATAAKLSENNSKTSELNSLANAQNAAASNNAPKWVSGTTYTAGQIAWSPVNGRIYKRLITGAGTIDPSADTTNWVLLSVVVEQVDVGTEPNQVPLNQYLGQLAFVSAVMKRPPDSATAQGDTGDIAQDGSYLYVCTNLNTWKRVQLTTW